MKKLVPSLLALSLAPAASYAQEACAFYKIQSGDSLRKIAEAAFGAPNYQLLWEANRAVIGSNPNLIRTGVELEIPCADGTLPSLKSAQTIQAAKEAENAAAALAQAEAEAKAAAIAAAQATSEAERARALAESDAKAAAAEAARAKAEAETARVNAEETRLKAEQEAKAAEEAAIAANAEAEAAKNEAASASEAARLAQAEADAANTEAATAKAEAAAARAETAAAKSAAETAKAAAAAEARTAALVKSQLENEAAARTKAEAEMKRAEADMKRAEAETLQARAEAKAAAEAEARMEQMAKAAQAEAAQAKTEAARAVAEAERRAAEMEAAANAAARSVEIAAAARTDLMDLPPMTFVTGNGFAPYADETLPGGGIFTQLVETAAARAAPDLEYRLFFINDWNAHIEDLLPERIFDAGYPWTRPNCEVEATLSYEDKYRCDSFVFSDPFYEVVNGYYTLKDSDYSNAYNYLQFEDSKICRPASASLAPLTSAGLTEPMVSLMRPDVASDCFRDLMDGKVDVVSMESKAAWDTIEMLDLTSAIVENPNLAHIDTLNVMIHKSNPEVTNYIRMLNAGLQIMRDSGEWYHIVSTGLRAQALRHSN